MAPKKIHFSKGLTPYFFLLVTTRPVPPPDDQLLEGGTDSQVKGVCPQDEGGITEGVDQFAGGGEQLLGLAEGSVHVRISRQGCGERLSFACRVE